MIVSKKWLSMAVVLSVFALSACQKDADTGAATGSKGDSNIPVVTEYTVAVDAAYAPLEYQNEHNQVTGFSVEILSAIANKAGFKVKFYNNPWEGIFATLAQGDRDIISSSVTITDARKKEVDFSDPYFDATQLIAVNKNNQDIKGYQDLLDKSVSVQTGTTGDEVMKKLQGNSSSKIKRFDNMPLALKELLAGGVEASVGDNGVIQHFVQNNSATSLRFIADKANFPLEHYGYVVKKGRQDLLDKINLGLKGIKEDGTYEQIYQKYFGTK